MAKVKDELFDETEKRIARVQADVQNTQGKDLTAKGAEPCKNCGHTPIAMIKTPAHMRDGMEVPAVVEVGCIVCPPYYIKHAEGTDAKLDGKAAKVKRRSYSARAYSLAEAAKNWNEGNHVEDHKLDLNIPASERARLS